MDCIPSPIVCTQREGTGTAESARGDRTNTSHPRTYPIGLQPIPARCDALSMLIFNFESGSNLVVCIRFPIRLPRLDQYSKMRGGRFSYLRISRMQTQDRNDDSDNSNYVPRQSYRVLVQVWDVVVHGNPPTRKPNYVAIRCIVKLCTTESHPFGILSQNCATTRTLGSAVFIGTFFRSK